MTTVGEILQTARLRKKLTLEQVEKSIKIRAKFLDAIEKNQFEKLPPGTFTRGFIKNYATYLGVSGEEALAFYRRQSSESPVDVVPLKNQKNLSKKFAFTPQVFTTISIGFLLLIFFAYLIFSYFRYAGSPPLVVSSPANNVVVKVDSVDVNGKTDADANLTINDQQVTVDQNGKFGVRIKLQPGLNTITVVATNKFQKQSTVTRNLRLEQ